MLSSGTRVAAAAPRRSARRAHRVSCIAAPERPATSTSIKVLPGPATTDRAASGRQASAAGQSASLVRSSGPTREPVPTPATRKQLSRREFEWADASYNPKTRSAKIWCEEREILFWQVVEVFGCFFFFWRRWDHRRSLFVKLSPWHTMAKTRALVAVSTCAAS